jgi:ion channel
MPRPASIPALWSTDRALTVVLLSLVTIMFILPSVRSAAASSLLVQVFFTVVFVSGLGSSAAGPALRTIAVIVFLCTIALHWIDYFYPGAGLGPWTAFGHVVAVAFLITLIVRHVFREGPITIPRIQGAVAVYLLLGALWGGIYETINDFAPGAFRFADPPQSPRELTTSLAYYSFVTLTTMGYGDITPVHPAARSAAMVEALVGQLFPAILIARLVAMELGARERRGTPR